MAALLQPLEDERLEQLQRHLLGQPALVQLQLRTGHDHRAPRVVHPLAQQVLAEAPGLALQRVGQRLQRTPVRAAQLRAPAAVVEQRVDGFLQHALLVAHDHVRGAQVEQLLEAVVAVDDPAVQVVEVRSREPPPVERHQGPQLGRNHRQHVQDHPLRLVGRLREGVHDLETAGDLQLLRLRIVVIAAALARAAPPQMAARAVAAGRVIAAPLAVARPLLAVLRRVRAVAGMLAAPTAVARFRPLGTGLHLAAGVRRMRAVLALAVGFALAAPAVLHLEAQAGRQLVQPVIQVTQQLLDALRAHQGGVLEVLVVQLLLPSVGDDLSLLDDVGVLGVDHDVGVVVQHLLKVLHLDVEQRADLARQHLEVPHVRAGRGQLHMPHPLAPHAAARHLGAALLADHAAVLHALVLAAQAFPVGGGSEDGRAEETVALGLESPVVDGLGLGHLPVGPAADLLRRSQSDADLVEIVLGLRLLALSAIKQVFLLRQRSASGHAPHA